MAPRTPRRGAAGDGPEPGLLAEAAAHGDRAAQSLLFERMQPMLARVAAELAGQGLSAAELVQEGSVGLLAAIESFETSGREDFDQYAEERARASMKGAVAAEAGARAASARLVAEANAFEEAELKLRRELGREATVKELAQNLEWPVAKVDEVAAVVETARREHDEELAGYLEAEYFDPIEWIGGDGHKGGSGEEGRGG